MNIKELVERNMTCDNDGKIIDESGNIFCEENGEQARLSKEDLARIKRESLVRYEVENNQAWKYRDLRPMYYDGIIGWKDCSDYAVEETFSEWECEITKDDIEWADYQVK